jgi:hypothetical protein
MFFIRFQALIHEIRTADVHPEADQGGGLRKESRIREKLNEEVDHGEAVDQGLSYGVVHGVVRGNEGREIQTAEEGQIGGPRWGGGPLMNVDQMIEDRRRREGRHKREDRRRREGRRGRDHEGGRVEETLKVPIQVLRKNQQTVASGVALAVVVAVVVEFLTPASPKLQHVRLSSLAVLGFSPKVITIPKLIPLVSKSTSKATTSPRICRNNKFRFRKL